MLQCRKLLAPAIAMAVAMATLKARAAMLEGGDTLTRPPEGLSARAL